MKLVPKGEISSYMDKELLISSLVPLPVQAALVKSSVHEAHFHFLAGCSLDPLLFYVALSKAQPDLLALAYLVSFT